MNYLIQCTGFIGDVLFASSIAEKMKECGVHRVDYYIPELKQPKLLLQNNPWIDFVYSKTTIPPSLENYDYTYITPEIDQRYPATIQLQSQVGIVDPTLPFDVYTLSAYDLQAQEEVSHLRSAFPGMPIIGYQVGWIEKSFKFTEAEYWRGRDVPHLGYGGRKHDISFIIDSLKSRFVMYPIGLPAGTPQTHATANDATSYAYTASILKCLDGMIGPEGGLTNLSSAVHTKTIITTDFIWQLYGPNGLLKKIDNPQMGPKTYYPLFGHAHIQPFADEDEIIETIINLVG